MKNKKEKELEGLPISAEYIQPGRCVIIKDNKVYTHPDVKSLWEKKGFRSPAEAVAFALRKIKNVVSPITVE